MKTIITLVSIRRRHHHLDTGDINNTLFGRIVIKKTLKILGTAVLLMLLLAFGMPGPALAGGGGGGAVPVTINAPAEVDPDTDFTATVDIGDVSELNAAQYDIWFDPAVLRLDSINHGQIDSEMIIAMPNKIADGHWMVVNYLLIMTDNISGFGYLCVLHFHTIGVPGESSDIEITDGILSGINGEITATWIGDTVLIPEPEPPSVTTSMATGITDMTAKLSGDLGNLGDYTSLSLSFVWGPSSESDPVNYPNEITATPAFLAAPGAFFAELSGLTPNTPYYYCAKVADGSDIFYGTEQTFTTYSLPLQVWVDDDFNVSTLGWGHDAFATIQDAINGVEPLVGIVKVYNGTYIDNVSVNKSVTVQSVNGPGVTTIILGTTSYFEVVIDSVDIIGFNVTGSSPNGIYLNQVYYCNISDCIVSGFERGIFLVEADNNRLDGNTLRDNFHGINFNNSQDNEVLGNNIFENNEDGIYLSNASPGNVIHFNNIVGNVDFGVYNENISENVSAEDNWWGDATGPGTVGPGAGDNVTKNIDYTSWLRAAVGNVTDGSITNGTLDAVAEADTEVVITGNTTVIVVKYTDNPGAKSLGGNIGKYVDVQISDTSNVDEIEIRLYYTDAEITGKIESTLQLYWWNGSDWVPCVPTSVVHPDAINGYSGYISVIIRNDGTTSPSLADLAGTPLGPRANTSGGSGSGGGGGGDVGSSGTVSLLEYINSDGLFISNATAVSPDGLVKIFIPKNTTGKSRTGQRLRYVTIKNKSAPSDSPAECEYVCLTYEIGPTGSTFGPLAYLIFKYKDSNVPEGVAEENLVLVTWQDGAWIELEGCVVDPEKNTITVPISHLSTFTAMAHTSPAKFEVSKITVAPSEVYPEEAVTVSVWVTNTGALTGDYDVTLNINNLKLQTVRITLESGKNKLVSFTITAADPGEYTVNINGLSSKYTIKEPEPDGVVAEVKTPEPPASSSEPTIQTPLANTPETTTQPEPKPESPVQPMVESTPSTGIAWWLIVIYVVCGIIVVSLPTYIFIRRRRTVG
jgi:parallel beta-helix repeat protein